MQHSTAGHRQPAIRCKRSPIELALLRLADRVSFDERLGCYRLDGRPVRVQDLLRAASVNA